MAKSSKKLNSNSKNATNLPAKQVAAQTISTNRRAYQDYEILDKYEAGLVLVGSEVKSLRESNVTLSESYARIDNNELWLQSLYIAPYSHAGNAGGHDPDRAKKLLLHRSQLNRIKTRLDQDRPHFGTAFFIFQTR